MKTKLKPFDLEAALNGAEVVTRSGKQVSELVYLKTIEHPTYRVIASIDGGLETYSEQGAHHSDISSEFDLFMKPQQVTKWVNLYRGCNSGVVRTGAATYNTEQEAKDAVEDYNHEYFSTIQITFEL